MIANIFTYISGISKSGESAMSSLGGANPSMELSEWVQALWAYYLPALASFRGKQSGGVVGYHRIPLSDYIGGSLDS